MTSAEQVWVKTNPEIWVVTAAHESLRGGLVATFVSQASIVPNLPRVIVGLAKQHHTWGIIENSGVFGLNLVGEDHVDWVWHFGMQSGRSTDKLTDIATTWSSAGSPMLDDAIAWLDCKVEASFDTGDRTIYLAEVVAAESRRDTTPLTIKRVLEMAPPERLQQMKVGLTRDSDIDAKAILQWRGKN